jgi:hypothetical protein
MISPYCIRRKDIKQLNNLVFKKLICQKTKKRVQGDQRKNSSPKNLKRKLNPDQEDQERIRKIFQLQIR